MHFLAQIYTTPGSTTTTQISSGTLAAIYGVALVFAIFYCVCLWKIFTKAGEPGWYAIVPILNSYTMIKIAGRPGWWLLLFFVPCVNWIVAIIVFIDLAAAFGKGAGFGIGLFFLGFIFLPILAFGDVRYGRATSYAPAVAGYGYGYGGQTQGWNQGAAEVPAPGAWPQQAVPTATPAPSSTPAAGWYPDPSGSGQRWWDGNAWTEHTSP